MDIPEVTPDGHVVGFNLDGYADDPTTPAREDVDDGDLVCWGVGHLGSGLSGPVSTPVRVVSD